MNLRFYVNPDTGEPHIYDHHVDEDEVLEVLRKPLEEFRGRRAAIIAHGQTVSGRYLKVIYVPDEDGDGIFIVMAYDLSRRQVQALRRRLRRKRR